jgi:hypothetical protein
MIAREGLGNKPYSGDMSKNLIVERQGKGCSLMNEN